MVSFEEYIGQFQRRSKDMDPDTINDYIEQYSVIDTLFAMGPMVPYLLNLATLKYVYLCKSVVNLFGLPRAHFLEGGVHKLFNGIHPDDRSIMLHNVFPKFRKIKKEKPEDQIRKLRFDFNYRFNHPEKQYIHCLEKIKILETDGHGNPSLIFGLITDISDFKEDNSIVASVSLLNKTEVYETTYVEVFKGVAQHLFTTREMYVLRLLAEGMSSKEIAVKLFISSTTVDKHRRNILSKYSKKNTRELIHYANRQGWL